MIGDDLAIARLHLAVALLMVGGMVVLITLANRRVEHAKIVHRQERATLGAELERLQGILVSRHGDRAADRPGYIAPEEGPAEPMEPEQ